LACQTGVASRGYPPIGSTGNEVEKFLLTRHMPPGKFHLLQAGQPATMRNCSPLKQRASRGVNARCRGFERRLCRIDCMCSAAKGVDRLLDTEAAGCVDALARGSTDGHRWEPSPTRGFELLTRHFRLGTGALHLGMHLRNP
jgi:hypothetical protein